MILEIFKDIYMEIWLPTKTLYIKESIPVSTLVTIRKIIKDYELDIKNIVVKGGNR